MKNNKSVTPLQNIFAMGRLAVRNLEKVKRDVVDLLITGTFASLKTSIRSTLKRVRIQNEKKTPKYPRIAKKHLQGLLQSTFPKKSQVIEQTKLTSLFCVY